MRLNLGAIAIVGEMAFRNLFANRRKTIVMGGVLGVTAFAMVLGGSVSAGVNGGLRRSVVDSMSGQLHVYSATSAGQLALLGDTGDSPMQPIPDFARLHAAMSGVPNVRAIVPMGTLQAAVYLEPPLDREVGALRAMIGEGSRPTASDPGYIAQKAKVQRSIRALQRELAVVDAVGASHPNSVAADMARVVSDDFWRAFDADPASHLEVLERRVSRLVLEGESLPMRFFGTDVQAFSASFSRMRIVRGEAVPAGHRGVLVSNYVYENQAKLRAATVLDRLESARVERSARIALDPTLSQLVRATADGMNEVVRSVRDGQESTVRTLLQGLLATEEPELEKLFARFFALDDANFEARHAFFYTQVAPHLDLYRFPIGGEIVLTSNTRRGETRRRRVKVYGTFEFEGLEASPQAGTVNLVDLVSFRDLYGFESEAERAELREMAAAAGATPIGRERAEAELFATPDDGGELTGAPPPLEELLSGFDGIRTRLEQARDLTYDASSTWRGPVLSAAILLHDERQAESTVPQLAAAAQRAGVPVRVVGWRAVSGALGEFLALMEGVLMAVVAVMLLVGVIVINSTLVMATLDRGKEI